MGRVRIASMMYVMNYGFLNVRRNGTYTHTHKLMHEKKATNKQQQSMYK